MSVENPGPVRLVGTLTIAGLVSGLILVGVYLATKPTIDHNRAVALQAAITRVVPGARGSTAMTWQGGALVEAPPGTTEGVVYAATNAEGELVGYAIPAAGPGFADTITILYGFDSARGLIVGMEVLLSTETPGLGDKIKADPDFLLNFRDLAVVPQIMPVGHDLDTQPNEVDCITGATISSKAIVRILNTSMTEWRTRLVAPVSGGES